MIIQIMPTKKKPEYTMVRFRKPGHKGETWHVSVHGKGGGPHTAHGYDPTIPMTFESEVTRTIAGQYHVDVLVAYHEKALRGDRNAPFPKMVMKRLFNRAAAFCTKHGFVNVDPRWKK